MFKWIKNWWEGRKRAKERKRKLARMKKQDPFIYD